MIEACEYKRSFLKYHPSISVIVNIDLDHLDYYKNLEDYISAFQSLVDQTKEFVIISADDVNSQKLIIPKEKKIIVSDTEIRYYAKIESIEHCGTTVSYEEKTLAIPHFELQIPGNHILQDARLVYTVAKLLGLNDDWTIEKLTSYRGSWRRSEYIGTTKNGNIVMSDY